MFVRNGHNENPLQTAWASCLTTTVNGCVSVSVLHRDTLVPNYNEYHERDFAHDSPVDHNMICIKSFVIIALQVSIRSSTLIISAINYNG